MESRGITSPVVEIKCKFVSMTRFNDNVLIHVRISEYNGVKLRLEYSIVDKATGALRAEGESLHGFLNSDGRPVSLRRAAPDFDAIFCTEIL